MHDQSWLFDISQCVGEAGVLKMKLMARVLLKQIECVAVGVSTCHDSENIIGLSCSDTRINIVQSPMDMIRTVYRMCSSGSISYVTLGRRRISSSSIMEVVEDMTLSRAGTG